MTEEPETGWYPDPTEPERARYWDGSGWTAHTGPREGPEGRPAPYSSFPDDASAPITEREPPKPLHGVAWWAYGVLAFAVLASVGYTIVALIYADKVQTQIDTHSLTLQQAEDVTPPSWLFC